MPSATRLPADARRSLLLYNLLFPLAFLALLPGFLRRMFRRGNYREKFRQRLGRYTPDERARFAQGEWLWLHSISVGETFLALKLAQKIRELAPGTSIALSVTTSTGFAVAQERACDWLEVIYNPLDVPWLVRRSLDAVHPRRLIFIEAIWPNLLAEAKRRGLPVTFFPRLSPRSEARFRRARFLTGPIFRLLDALAASEPEDVRRWAGLGVDPARIHVTGNVKFDSATPAGHRTAEFRALLQSLGVPNDAPILLGGSTFAGEERILAEVFRELRLQFPTLFFILVPRHIERTSEILQDLAPLDLQVIRRSDFGTRAERQRDAHGTTEANPSDILIVDTTGELRDWYTVATVVFIGKSLTSTGGQNPVEPVLAGKPVVFGPHMENFAAVVSRWLAADAAVQVRDAAELRAQVATLLNDAPRRAQLVERARDIAAIHTGATTRTAQVLLGT
jgi:3-deoxy-D-manno-octulosonic-acid transferase